MSNQANALKLFSSSYPMVISMKKLLLFFAFLYTLTLNANVIKVTSLANSGTGSLRDALEINANNGDTVLIDVRGDIQLSTPISVNGLSDVTIIGATPKHTTIQTAAAFSGASLIIVEASSFIRFQMIGFSAGGTSNVRHMHFLNNSSPITVENCVFKNASISGDGGAVLVEGSDLTFNNCSFVSNNALNGGAVRVSSANATFRNCTFWSNTASNQGGAVLLASPTTTNFFHNTFHQNNASGGFACAAVGPSATNLIYLQSNAFSSNGGTNGQFVGAASYTSNGGNKFKKNSATDNPPWTQIGTDESETSLNFYLRSSIVEDGYGLMYFTITSQLSDLVDAGQPVTFNHDARRAPRALKSFPVGPVYPDAGACEYTNIRITSSSNTNVVGSILWAFDLSQNFNPVNYVEFDLTGAPLTIPISGGLILQGTYIVDAFSQSGSAVPGPANDGSFSLTPANIPVTIQNPGAVTTGVFVTATSTGSVISGLRIIGFNDDGIHSLGANTIIEGCEIGITNTNSASPNLQSGIQIFSDNTRVGGFFDWQRNVISGNGGTEVTVEGAVPGVKIVGNIIGLDREGDAAFSGTSSTYGIYDRGDGTIIGSPHAGNIIGNKSDGISLVTATFTKIYSNYIGVANDGVTAVPNSTGIYINSNSQNISVGFNAPGFGNIISGNNSVQIRIDEVNGVQISNNFIGPDITGETAAANTIHGIYFDHTQANNVVIGGTNPNDRNIISGNQFGINFQNNGGFCQVLNNYIGTNKDGNVAIPNTSAGILLSAGVTSGAVQIGAPGSGNVISGHTVGFGVGILIEEGADHLIRSNRIGTVASGDLDLVNNIGIQLSNCSGVIIGGDFISGEGNVISGHVLYGIDLGVNTQVTSIRGNIIGLSFDQSAVIENGVAGIRVNDANTTTIGGTDEFRNVITGQLSSSSYGILLDGNGTGTDISANAIGQNFDGTVAIGNYQGIHVTGNHQAQIGGANPNYIVKSTDAGISCNGSQPFTIAGNVIGKSSNGAVLGYENNFGIIVNQPDVSIGGALQNVIVNSVNHGILVNGELADNVVIDNNFIGTDQFNTIGFENQGDGIRVVDADNGMIGNMTGNVICGNNSAGIRLTGTVEDYVISKNTVADLIGGSLTNGKGIYIVGGPSNNFIGTSYGATGDNIIGNSIEEGILIENAGVNFIYGNDIGNDGLVAFPNNVGIRILNTTGTVIGAPGGLRNVISGNMLSGVLLDDAPSTTIQSNNIGVNVNGNVALPNANGIEIYGSSENTLIGGTANADFANTISGNNAGGIYSESPIIVIQKNFIGSSTGGLSTVGNQLIGIELSTGAQNCTIGGDRTTQGNLITGNLNNGIRIIESNNQIFGNVFGVSSTFNSIFQTPIGIALEGANCNNNLIGTEPSGGEEYGNIIMDHSTAGIQIQNGANNNSIASNYIGTEPSGSSSFLQLNGVSVLATAGIDNVIGKDVANGHNVISGNITGIRIDGGVHTFIYNNRIGTAPDGLGLISNTQNGIHFINAGFNTIGGPGLKANLISGNVQNGILIEGVSSTNNEIAGNIIGSNASLSSVSPNGIGIKIQNDANNNFIGLSSGSENIITGNSIAGIVIDNAYSNTVHNNRVGLPFANNHGIILQNGATTNTIGGDFLERNIVSNNDSIGIALNNANTNFISGNFVGSNALGNLAQPNLIGIGLFNSDFNEIGNGTNFNLISSNTMVGVIIENSNSNTLKNNYIGTDTTGNLAYPGAGNGMGIVIKFADNNLIGGNNTIDEENIISNNAGPGIYLENAELNEIYGNKIGITKDGSSYLGNTGEGILMRLSADNNLIGSSVSGLANAIAANSKGIYIKHSSANQIESNFIGNNLDGTSNLPGTNNQTVGIHIDSASTQNIVSDLNIISGNLNYGLVITGKNTNQNEVKGNYFGLTSDGNNGLPNPTSNVAIADSAKFNLVGGQTVLDRNYFGGNTQFHVAISDAADTNQIAGNYINLALDGSTTFSCVNGVFISVESTGNIIGGGLPGEGNTIVNTTSDGLYISNSHYTKILGNRIGIKPDSSPGAIAGDGVRFHGADYSWMGAYLPGSDSMNIVTNCNRGVSIMTLGALNSAYGNVIGGNTIYDNVGLGIDMDGDDSVEPIDTVNNSIFENNGGIDMPEIVSAWTCGDGFTHVGFKFFASNTLTYHIEFYSNTSLDPSTYGEGQNYLGDHVFVPTTNYDTINVNLGVSLPTGTVLTATITGFLGNTSEFSKQFAVTDPPVIDSPTVVDETCLGANDGIVSMVATDAYAFSADGGLTWTYNTGSVSMNLPTGTHTIDALYLNGCTQSETAVLNPGLPLPFDYVVIPDTCGQSLGQIEIDTLSTNGAGGTGNYSFTFNNGVFYNSDIDSTNLTAGNYQIGLFDITLGCYSDIENVLVSEVTDVIDESFVYEDFCSNEIPLPTSIATSGGVFSFEVTPGDGATISASSGEISGATVGNSYNVIYTVGVCNEKDTVTVAALNSDDATFTFDDFCQGANQNIVITGLAGGTFSFDPEPGDGAVIDPVTGVISNASGSTYSVKYVTNGSCPDSSTVNVQIFPQPPAPDIIATDSIYCDQNFFSSLIVNPGSYTANWMLGSPSSLVVATSSDFTPTSLNVGDNYIYVVLTDGGTCISEADSINYVLSDLTLLSAGNDVTTCIGSEIQLNATGGQFYLWSANDDLSDINIADPIVKVDDVDTYIVTITDSNGCIKIDSINVDLLPLDSCFVDTYNAFSPNGDGRNDFWIIDGIEGYSENTVTIFNRWGDVIIRFDNYNNSTVIWNGHDNGDKLVPSGTYYFVVDVNGSQNQSGWVQVVY